MNVQQRIVAMGGQIRQDPISDLLTINGEFTASIVLARCCTLSSGNLRWKIRLDTALKPDISIAVRMDENNENPRDYYLLPSMEFPSERLSLATRNPIQFESFRFDTLDFFFGMAERYKLRRVA